MDSIKTDFNKELFLQETGFVEYPDVEKIYINRSLIHQHYLYFYMNGIPIHVKYADFTEKNSQSSMNKIIFDIKIHLPVDKDLYMSICFLDSGSSNLSYKLVMSYLRRKNDFEGLVSLIVYLSPFIDNAIFYNILVVETFVESYGEFDFDQFDQFYENWQKFREFPDFKSLLFHFVNDEISFKANSNILPEKRYRFGVFPSRIEYPTVEIIRNIYITSNTLEKLRGNIHFLMVDHVW